jgi:uncharacterized protein DUF3768
MARSKTEIIRNLNDAFRTSMTGGRVMMTAGFNALPSDVRAKAIREVATFADFTPDNDPHGEHDFGNFGSSSASTAAVPGTPRSAPCSASPLATHPSATTC